MVGSDFRRDATRDKRRITNRRQGHCQLKSPFGRLPANSVLQESIGWLLKSPVGRPPQEVRRYHASFSYRAGSWTKPRRVVVKVEWHPGELYPRVGFKIVVYDNGALGFIELEQKAAGLVPIYTDLKNPNFGEVARAMGLWGSMASKAGEPEDAIRTWLAQPGPAVLHVKVKPMQLVTPPAPFVSPEAIVGMAVYSAKVMLHGKGHDVWEMIVENIS
jgi:hypothetical protein